MSKQNKPLDLRKTIEKLIKIVDKQQVQIKELKKLLHVYQSGEVYDTWKVMGASEEEINKVISMLKNVKVL